MIFIDFNCLGALRVLSIYFFLSFLYKLCKIDKSAVAIGLFYNWRTFLGQECVAELFIFSILFFIFLLQAEKMATIIETTG